MRYIFSGFSPNTRREDVRLATKLLFTPWTWRQTGPSQKLEAWFQTYFAVPTAVSFDSGRTALQAALQAVGVGAGDEVIVQAFTCVVVTNAITWLGAKPIFVDIFSGTYTADPVAVERAITNKTKAIIAQHTFGQPVAPEIFAIAEKHNIPVVEDCAHALGGYDAAGKLLGTRGAAAIFSFGSDKVISGVRGGMAISADPQVADRLRAFQAKLPALPRWVIKMHLQNPLMFSLGKATYHWGFGKILLALSKKTRAINRIIEPAEKKGRGVRWFPAQLPGALAELALEQITHLDTWNKIRQQTAKMYATRLAHNPAILSCGTDQTWLRFPVQVRDLPAILARARQANIMLGDWYRTPIAPQDSDYSAAHYVPGSCAVAEKTGETIINLPTSPNLTAADHVRLLSLFN